MANNYEVCLYGVMNRLWFQQIILFPEPTSLVLHPKTLIKTSKRISESLPCLPSITKEEMSPIPSSVSPSKDDSNNINNEDDGKKLSTVKESPERLNLVMRSKSRRSQSSSPLTKKRSICLSNYSGSIRRLHKTMSCKSLWELELEEVKGFTDLGFIFTKENLSPQMMSVVPGLQRLGGYTNNEPTISELFTTNAAYKDEDDDEEEEEEEEERRGLMTRPYLSEAWLIKRPDSPLLNLRIPRVSAASDMKKHIRNWARTVASVIHQES